MAYSTITKPKLYFETTTYTGGATDVSSLSFQPDWVWAKKRSGAENHGLFDSVRGATKALNSNTTSAEDTRSGSLTSFDNDGWSMGGSDGIISASGSTYVGWAWKANGAVSNNNNNDGQQYSTVSANTTAGFSIVSYTGTGSNTNYGHGLGVAPKMIIVKNRSDSSGHWRVYHASQGNTKYANLDGTAAFSASSTTWNNTTPTNSVFYVGSDSRANGSGNAMIAYCFAEKKGYSKFGSYEGNGNVDGAFVYTGFKPAWIMVKRAGGVTNWQIQDSKRDGFNDQNKRILANVNEAEKTSQMWDQLSNGFKIRVTSENANGSGMSYIYMAFAEEPLVANVGTNGVPATAR
jgi:hypothetical protein